MVVAAVAMIVGGVIVVVVGRLAVHGRLRRNRWVGLRSSATLADDRAWYVGNRVAAPWFLTAGAVLAGTGSLLLLARPDEETALTVAGAGAVLSGALAIVGGILGHRTARAVLRAGTDASGEGPAGR